MKRQKAFYSKVTFTPSATDRVSVAARPHEFYYREVQKNSFVPRLPRLQRASNIQKTYTSLLSILAIALLLVSCYRVTRFKILSADAGRRLAGGGFYDDEGAGRSAIPEMCFGMQEQSVLDVQSLMPPLSPSETLSLILETREEQSPNSVKQLPGGGLLPSASLKLTAPTLPSQPDPFFVGTIGREFGGVRVREDAALQAAPLLPPPHHSIEVVSQDTPPLRQVLQTSSATLLQQGSFTDCSAGPSSTSAVHAEISLASPDAGTAVLQRSLSSAAEPQAPEPSQRALGRKRGITESTASKPTHSSMPTSGQPNTKKHISGEEFSSAAAPAFSLPVAEQPQEPALEGLEDESLLQAFDVVPWAWSPETLAILKMVGDELQSSEQEDRLLGAREAALEDVYIPGPEVPLTAAPPPETSLSLGAEGKLFDPASKSFVPSALQGLGPPLTVSVKVPLPDQSGGTFPTMPLFCGEGGEGVQPKPQSPLTLFPETSSIFEMLGGALQRSDHEAEEKDQLFRAPQAVSEHAYTPELESPSTAPLPFGTSPFLGGEGWPLNPASDRSPIPSTSAGLGRTQSAPVKNSLQQQSGEAFSSMPFVSGDGGESVQPRPQNFWTLSPETLDILETLGIELQEAEKEDQLLGAREAVSAHADTSKLKSLPTATSHSSTLPFLGAEECPFAPDVEGPLIPSTSQKVGCPTDAAIKNSSAHPSWEASPTVPPVPGDGGKNLQPKPQSSLPALAVPGPRMASSTHVYYRLPFLRPGRVARSFNVERAFAECNKRVRSFPSLLRLRALLERIEITPQDASALVAHSEEVVGRLYYDLQLPIATGWLAGVVAQLGRLYLYLDMVISVVQVVGPSMHASEWWPRIQSVIPSPIFITTRYWGRADCKEHAILATELSRALQLMKMGTRLGEEDTIKLKKQLFGKGAVKEFKRTKWDPWRKDIEESGESAASD